MNLSLIESNLIEPNKMLHHLSVFTSARIVRFRIDRNLLAISEFKLILHKICQKRFQIFARQYVPIFGLSTQGQEYLKIRLKRAHVLKKLLKRRLGANFRT